MDRIQTFLNGISDPNSPLSMLDPQLVRRIIEAYRESDSKITVVGGVGITKVYVNHASVAHCECESINVTGNAKVPEPIERMNAATKGYVDSRLPIVPWAISIETYWDSMNGSRFEGKCVLRCSRFGSMVIISMYPSRITVSETSYMTTSESIPTDMIPQSDFTFLTLVNINGSGKVVKGTVGTNGRISIYPTNGETARDFTPSTNIQVQFNISYNV